MAVLETYPGHVTWLHTTRLHVIYDVCDDVQQDGVGPLCGQPHTCNLGWYLKKKLPPYSPGYNTEYFTFPPFPISPLLVPPLSFPFPGLFEAGKGVYPQWVHVGSVRHSSSGGRQRPHKSAHYRRCLSSI